MAVLPLIDGLIRPPAATLKPYTAAPPLKKTAPPGFENPQRTPIGGTPTVATAPSHGGATTTVTPPATTPTPPGPSSDAGATPPAASAYDLSTDPIVQKIRALNHQNMGDAVAAADRQRKQLLVSSGFGDLARAAQFGGLDTPVTGDESTALAAGQNPFSTAAQLKLGHEQAQHQIDQADNRENIFYSSTRANHLADEGRNYLQQESGAEDQVREQLSTILSNLLNERSTENGNFANAIETARQNAITNSIANGQTFAGYDANGNPIFKPAASAAAPTPTGLDLGTGFNPAALADPFANLNNLTPADWAKLAALPINQAARARTGTAVPA